MNVKLKITTVGNSAGVVLPRELLARLRVGKGDTLYVTELADGIKLAPFDPEFAAKMDVAESVMRRRRDLLRKLAEN
jgi:putative addiction module antidote